MGMQHASVAWAKQCISGINSEFLLLSQISPARFKGLIVRGDRSRCIAGICGMRAKRLEIDSNLLIHNRSTRMATRRAAQIRNFFADRPTVEFDCPVPHSRSSHARPVSIANYLVSTLLYSPFCSQTNDQESFNKIAILHLHEFVAALLIRF